MLSDTVQCPTCQHVLKPEHAGANAADLPAVVKAAEDEVECPDCGEHVQRAGPLLALRWFSAGRHRRGSTRRCSTARSKVIYSLSTDSSDSEPSSTAGDDDFQLTGLNLMSRMKFSRDRRLQQPQLRNACDNNQLVIPQCTNRRLQRKQQRLPLQLRDTTNDAKSEAPDC